MRWLQCRHDEEWDGCITMNGTRIELAPGETPEEAGKRFAAEKEAERAAYSPEVLELLGTEHKGVKGAAAIDKLLEEKNGHVKNAFTKEGIGGIDLIWGDYNVGLQHIIKRRNDQGYDGESFLSEIPMVIRQGKVRERADGRFEIRHGNVLAIVSPRYNNDRFNFLLTAFEME